MIRVSEQSAYPLSLRLTMEKVTNPFIRAIRAPLVLAAYNSESIQSVNPSNPRTSHTFTNYSVELVTTTQGDKGHVFQFVANLSSVIETGSLLFAHWCLKGIINRFGVITWWSRFGHIVTK